MAEYAHRAQRGSRIVCCDDVRIAVTIAVEIAEHRQGSTKRHPPKWAAADATANLNTVVHQPVVRQTYNEISRTIIVPITGTAKPTIVVALGTRTRRCRHNLQQP